MLDYPALEAYNKRRNWLEDRFGSDRESDHEYSQYSMCDDYADAMRDELLARIEALEAELAAERSRKVFGELKEAREALAAILEQCKRSHRVREEGEDECSYSATLTCAICGKPLPKKCVFLGWSPVEGSICACPECAMIDADEQEADHA